MIIDPNEKSAKKKFPKLKAKAHETAISVFAFSQIWAKKMKQNDMVHQWVHFCLVTVHVEWMRSAEITRMKIKFLLQELMSYCVLL